MAALRAGPAEPGRTSVEAVPDILDGEPAGRPAVLAGSA